MNPLDAVLQLEAAGVGGGGAGVARVVRQLGEGGPVVAPQQQHAAGGAPGHVVFPVILQPCPCAMYDLILKVKTLFNSWGLCLDSIYSHEFDIFWTLLMDPSLVLVVTQEPPVKVEQECDALLPGPPRPPHARSPDWVWTYLHSHGMKCVKIYER